MASINANFQGRLGQDPTIHVNGTLTFSVAVNNYKKDNVSTTWISCSVFPSNQFTYEKAKKFLKKGSSIYALGGLEMNSYTNKDGKEVSGLNCIVNDFDFVLSTQKKEEGEVTGIENPTVNPVVQTQAQAENGEKKDLPF